MKKWKQILALTLAVVVTLSVVPVGDARAAVEEPTEYAIVGEIINADGAEITVKEISKDGTENVELPWEELEEDTQNSDTEKDTKIFYTDELEAGKDYLIEVQPKEDYKIVLDEENDFEEKGEGYQYAFSCTEDNNFFRFKAEAQKTTGEMTLNIVTDEKSDFSGGSVTVYKIKEDGEEECTPSESAQGVKKYNVNAENDYRIEVKPDRDAGYEFQNNQKPDDYTYDEENDIYYKTFSCTTEKLSYSEQISFVLKKVKIKLELSEGGGIQIGDTAYNKSEEIDCKYGDIVVNVKVTDCAGNVTEKAVTISIDKTAPEISISYNDIAPDSIYTSVYKDVRVATVTVRERNFDENDIAWNLISTHGAEAQISGWTEYTEEGNPDNSVHMATVTFAADDDYRFSMSGRDRAGNNATTFPEQTFTIDRTNPVIEVTMDGQAANGNYYAQDRTATIKVTEHNFDAGRIEVHGTAADNGQTTVFPALSGWTTDGDVHMATISFAVDGNYAFTVDAMDEAGNAAVQSSTSEFVIDKTEPVIEISGIENDSANNDVVMPAVQFSDTNYNEGAATIELSGANHGIVHYDGAFAQTENGQTFTFSDFAHEQDVDDIYTLTAREIDFAGNETEQSITFSVNRFGSVYVLDDSLKEIEGTYIKEPIDIVLTETNVDSLSMDTIKITVSANGEPKNLEEGTDYTITSVGGNGSWSQYTYKIDKSVFQGDGSYLVTVYSEDNAGNINENINESKKAEIGFGVDGTAPVIVPINIEEGQSYNTQNYEATVSVIDNLVLQDIKVTLNGQTLSYTQDGDDISFSIPESDKRQTVAISAKDAAGNEVDCEIADLLVSTNSLIRLLNNTPAVIAIVCGVAVVGVGTGVFAGLRRKRIVHIKRKN